MIVASLMLLMASAGPANEVATSCDGDFTQMEMNACSYRTYQAADRELNDTWVAVANDVKNGRGNLEPLRKAQRTWITFRNQHCSAKADQFRGGSMRPLVLNTCLTNLTRERIVQLRDFYEAH